MKELVNPLLEWYYKNKRVLPWRIDKDPYHVWISEIMLQQTRIDAVINYYHRFMTELPTIEALANYSPDKLLKLWEGLGYYNRARNLQRSSQIIMNEYNGLFPTTYQEILALPGIGEYTASAIASICFSLKEATVDGNVLRVYMRINNCYHNVDDIKTRKMVREDLIKIMPEDSGSFNEALMELGERICIPIGVPKCRECPIKDFCKAYKKKTYLELPVKQSKQSKKEENYTTFLFCFSNMVAISKRSDMGLLHNMWQFPNLKNKMTLLETKKYLDTQSIKYCKIEKVKPYTHTFTHKKWNMYSYFIVLKDKIEIDNAIWVSLNDLENIYAIPTAFQPLKKYLIEKVDNNDEA